MRPRQRVRGATTVEWLVVAMVIGISGIIMWQTFGARLAGTVARGGDCVLALDGSCTGGAVGGVAAIIGAPSLQAGNAPAIVPAASSLPVGASVGSSSLSWGAPGFTQGWTPAEREQYLAQHGVADPDVRYFTPFWQAGPPNYYTGAPDTAGTNTFGVIHDYNITPRRLAVGGRLLRRGHAAVRPHAHRHRSIGDTNRPRDRSRPRTARSHT